MIDFLYPYIKLSRSNENGIRKYLCPDGQKLPSVTTILGKTRSEDSKRALKNWKQKLGPTLSSQITHEAASRGTRMHAFLEHFIKEDSFGNPGSNPFAQQSYRMAEKISQQGLSKVTRYYGSEVSLYCPSLYAGTTDCVADIDGELTIVDFKQSNHEKLDAYVEGYKQQIGAYAICHDELYGTHIRQGAIMMCTPDLIYQEWIIHEAELEKFKEIWLNNLQIYYANYN
ncbi:Uncharacterised protein [uncultured archaeon]|nr:Uncharacterised protein [uncultured archaeon]